MRSAATHLVVDLPGGDRVHSRLDLTDGHARVEHLDVITEAVRASRQGEHATPRETCTAPGRHNKRRVPDCPVDNANAGRCVGHHAVMSPNQPCDGRLEEVLNIYADDPLESGDVLLLLDGKVCMEITGLAAHWDDVLRGNTAGVLRETARSVVIAIARPEAMLLPSDIQLWQDLRDDLLDSDVTLLPVQALPAA